MNSTELETVITDMLLLNQKSKEYYNAILTHEPGSPEERDAERKWFGVDGAAQGFFYACNLLMTDEQEEIFHSRTKAQP